MYRKLDFSHEEELSYKELEKRVKAYLPNADLTLFKNAFDLSKEAHEGQKRSSGEDYFIHPCNVTAILIKLRIDINGLIAGLLHDVIEDCRISPEDIRRKFSSEVADIVIGMTKISQITFKTREESQAENFRKMVMAMAKDLRVIIVKLADRMHNMRTLQYIDDTKQKDIARETLDIYVSLAGRLGIHSIKSELEDLCLKFLHPGVYSRLGEKVAINTEKRDQYIEETVTSLNEKLLGYSVKAEIEGRLKSFYSLFKKMRRRGIDLDQLQGMLVFKIIISNITECYKVLGIIHSHFIPIPGKFRDYIAIPKINGHQSLQTTIIGPKFKRIKIQIKTHDMDEINEMGVAAQQRFKDGIYSGGKTDLNWIQELLEFNKNVGNNSEFMYAIKNDLDMGEIFVLTPKDDVKELPYGATPLDFAYAVHTEVGHRTIGAKVNGKTVNLKYSLRSGDTVEILTDNNQRPSKHWLNITKTSKAKTKIKQWILKMKKESNKVLEKPSDTIKNNLFKGRPRPILMHNKENVTIRMSRCCGPIPGDAIVGHMKLGKGITVHRSNCTKTGMGKSTRIVDVEWNPDRISKHPVNIRIIAHDRPGILSIISKSINKVGVNIRSASAKSTIDRKGDFIFEIEVSDHSELLKVINSIESLKEIISVIRN